MLLAPSQTVAMDHHGSIGTIISYDITVIFHDISTGWCPPVISWFINPINYIVISTINRLNHSEIGVIGTNLANELGHHLVLPSGYD